MSYTRRQQQQVDQQKMLLEQAKQHEAKLRRQYFTDCKQELEAALQRIKELQAAIEKYAQEVGSSKLPYKYELQRVVKALAGEYAKLVTQGKATVGKTEAVATWTPPGGSSTSSTGLQMGGLSSGAGLSAGAGTGLSAGTGFSAGTSGSGTSFGSGAGFGASAGTGAGFGLSAGAGISASGSGDDD